VRHLRIGGPREVVEWVATLPQYRRLGLMDRLLGAILERGAIADHRLAQDHLLYW